MTSFYLQGGFQMDTLKVDRRALGPASDPVSDQPDATRIVQQGILIQARVGTIGAVEFLKAHNVDGAVIHRVLTTQQVRADDRSPVA
jgi:hypothetical protein